MERTSLVQYRPDDRIEVVEGEAERASAGEAGVEPWPAGERELFLRIVPHRVTGRRIQLRLLARGQHQCRALPRERTPRAADG